MLPSRRVVFEGKGSIAPVGISADKSRILIQQGLSNREDRLSLLDIATGKVSELSWTNEPARYEEAALLSRRQQDHGHHRSR